MMNGWLETRSNLPPLLGHRMAGLNIAIAAEELLSAGWRSRASISSQRGCRPSLADLLWGGRRF